MYFTKILVSAVTFLALVVFVTTSRPLFSSSSDHEVERMSSATARIDTPHSAPPRRLRLPALGIDAAVQHVGLLRSGRVGVPTNFSDVGWYMHGPIPGQMGNALFDGHVDNALGLAGVFKILKKSSVGDDVYVVVADGTSHHFKITSVEIFSLETVPKDRIFGQKDYSGLALITCTGTWNRKKQTYNERVVAFARLVTPIQ
jgi:hypothetical protein